MILGLFSSTQATEITPRRPDATNAASTRPLSDVLPAATWREVEASVDRALTWLAAGQNADGSFPSIDAGQPGITSLAVMAFLSRGHQPGKGPYGERLNRAIDFVLSSQQPDGLYSYRRPENQHLLYRPSHTAAYNHPIAGLMLSEVYGQVTGERAARMKGGIEKALLFTRKFQTIRPKPPVDTGGWRYLHRTSNTDSDLSVTAWQLMFLRSAKNAEFDVPQAWVDEAMEYVQRCWNSSSGSFSYGIYSGSRNYGDTRGMTGAGILSLSLGGQHQTPMALAAGDWLLSHPYRYFGETTGYSDTFLYSTYYCSQAAAQLGGRYWERIYPAIVNVVLTSQKADGSWPLDVGVNGVAQFGTYYSTAMAVLSLTPPYQLLPVYQR